MSSKIFVLDIRDDAVTAVLVRSGLKENRVENQIRVDFREAPETDDRITWAMGRVTERIDTSGAISLVSISPTYVSYRNLQVPFKDRKKIRQILPFELEPTLPYDVEQLTLDFQVVRQGENTDLIAASVETDALNEILEILDQFDITPRYVTAGGVAAAMCLAQLSLSPIEDFLFLEVDNICASACVVVSGKIHLVRTLRRGNETDPELKAKRIASGLRRMLAAFESIYDFDATPERILISGVGASDAALVEALQQSLSIPVAPVNLINDTQLNVSASDEIQAAPELFNEALSLIGIETAGILPFNFSRSHYAFQKYWYENRNELITTGMLTLFVFILFMFHVVVDAHFLQKRVSQLNHQIASIFHNTFPEVSRVEDAYLQMQAELKQIKSNSVFSEQSRSNILNIDIIKDISRLVPPQLNVLMTRFVRGDDSVLLSGLTDTFNAVDDIKIRLEQSPLFSQITISSANMDKAENRVRFKIKADLSDTALE